MIKRRKPRRRAVALLALASLLVGVAVVSPATAERGKGHSMQGDSPNGHNRSLSFRLTSAEVPTGGDPDGRGGAQLTLHPKKEKVCFDVEWSRLDGAVTAMHIHKAPTGATGPHHIELFNDERFVGDSNRVAACVQVEDGGHGSAETAREKILAVVRDPQGYYLNVHSSAFPAGAIRGQLDGGRGGKHGGRAHDDD